ncbi:hypothetical protein KCV07_g92, partial [Aureobasidium melanogenum]
MMQTKKIPKHIPQFQEACETYLELCGQSDQPVLVHSGQVIRNQPFVAIQVLVEVSIRSTAEVSLDNSITTNMEPAFFSSTQHATISANGGTNLDHRTRHDSANTIESSIGQRYAAPTKHTESFRHSNKPALTTPPLTERLSREPRRVACSGEAQLQRESSVQRRWLLEKRRLHLSSRQPSLKDILIDQRRSNVVNGQRAALWTVLGAFLVCAVCLPHQMLGVCMSGTMLVLSISRGGTNVSSRMAATQKPSAHSAQLGRKATRVSPLSTPKAAADRLRSNDTFEMTPRLMCTDQSDVVRSFIITLLELLKHDIRTDLRAPAAIEDRKPSVISCSRHEIYPLDHRKTPYQTLRTRHVPNKRQSR